MAKRTRKKNLIIDAFKFAIKQGNLYKMLSLTRKFIQPPAVTDLILKEGKKGIAGDDLITSWTITASAGSYSRMGGLLTLSTLLAAKDSSEDNIQTIIDSYYVISDFWSSYQFLVTPFILQLEEGESITDANLTADNIQDQIEEIVSGKGTYSIKLGETTWSKRNYQGVNAGLYEAKISLNLSQECKRWMEDYYRRKQREEPVLPFYQGWIVRFYEADKSISYNKRVVTTSHESLISVNKVL